MGLFKRIKQRKQSQKTNTNHNVPFMLEMLEPRLLLSADLTTMGVAGVLSNGLGRFDSQLDDFIDVGYTNELNTRLPLVVRNEGTDILDYHSVAPKIREVLSVDVDINRDGHEGVNPDVTLPTWLTSAETELDGLDSDNNHKVDFLEFLQGGFFGEISPYLDGTKTNAEFVTALEGLDTTAGLQTGQAYTVESVDFYAPARWIELEVTSVSDTTTDNQVSFELDFSLTFRNELALDLGTVAEELGITFPDTNLDVDATLDFTVEVGVLTSGEIPNNDDFFLDFIQTSGDDLTLTVDGDIPTLNSDVSVGFLGAQVSAGSVTLTANLSGNMTDPTTPTTLGFTEAQFGQTAPNGTITAQNIPSAYDLTDDAVFILRIGSSDARTVTVGDVLTNGNGSLTDLVNDVDNAVSNAGLGSVIDVDSTSGKLTLSVVDFDATAFGFSSNEQSGTTLTGSSSVTSPSGSMSFLISVDHAVPVLISVSDVTNLTDLETKLDTALTNSGTGVTATWTGSLSDILELTTAGGKHLEISDNLTFDSKLSYSDLGQSITSLMGTTLDTSGSTFGVNLPIQVKSGLGFSLSGAAISFFVTTSDPFLLTAPTPDPDGNIRFDFDVDIIGVSPAEKQDVLNFTNISASDVVGLLRRLGNWLDEARQTDSFASIGIPLSDADLSDFLDFENMVADEWLAAGALITDNNDPNFSTAQQLAATLGTASYNAGTDELTYSVNLTHTFDPLTVPIDFNLDLTPLLDISSNSEVQLTADGTLTATLGFFLGDMPGGALTNNTTLESLGIDMEKIEAGVAVTAENTPRIIYGRLNNDATFDIEFGANTYRVIVYASDPDEEGLLPLTDDNLTVDDLVTDISYALQHAENVDTHVEVDLTTLGFSVAVDPDNAMRIKLSSSSTDFTLTAAQGDPAVNQLGFKTTHEAEGTAAPYSVVTTKDAPRLVGRLTGDTTFEVIIGSTHYTVTVEAGATDANRTIIDLISDLNRALETPSLVSGHVSAIDLTSAANFSISINGGTPVAVQIQPGSTDGSDYIAFDGASAPDLVKDTISFISPHKYLTGDEVVYTNGGDTSIDGLTNGATYYVIVVDDMTIKLAETEDDANSDLAIALLAVGAGANHRLTDTANADFKDLIDDINRAIAATTLAGLIKAEDYEWPTDPETHHIRLKAIDDSVVKFELTVTGGDPADTVLALPTGIHLYANLSDKIEVKSQGDRLVLRAYADEFTFDGAADVDVDEDTITIGSHNLVTGWAVEYTDGGGTNVSIGGLTHSTTYYVIVENSNSVKLAASEVDALVGTPINLTSAGSGADHQLTAAPVSAFDVDGTSASELGFSTGSSQIADNKDLIIYLSNNTHYTVSLDTATRIGDVIDLITNQTDGYGSIFLATLTQGDVLVEIDPDEGTGLRLKDNTFTGTPGSPLFRIEPTNASPAAIRLGILAIDPVGDLDDDGDVDAADGDSYIDGAPLTGADLADRFFLENAQLSATFGLNTPATPFTNLTIDATDATKVTSDTAFDMDNVGQYLDITAGAGFTFDRYKIINVDPVSGAAFLDDAPGATGITGGTGDIKGIQASASFGFVGIDLIGSGSLTGSVSAWLEKDDVQGARIYLSELVEDLSPVADYVDQPTFSGSGTFTLDVELSPEFLEIDLGTNPQITLNVASIGDPFTENIFDSPDPVIESANSFSWTGDDQTSLFTKGSVIQIEFESSTISALISGSSYDGAKTTVTLVSDVFSGMTVESTFDKVIAPTPPDISVTVLDLGELVKFEDIGFSNILDALSDLVDFLNGIEGLDFFDQEIPLINKSVSDLLSFADKFATALDDIESDPAGNLQLLEAKLRNAFGLPAVSGPDFKLSLVGDVLKFELDLGISFNESLGVEIPEFLDLGSLGISGLSGAIDLGGSADLNASGSLTAVLDFGIDLGITVPLNLGDIYIYDTTGVEAEISASGENLSFWASLGPFGLFIQNHPDYLSEIDISGSFSAGVKDSANTGDKAKIGDVSFDLDNFDTEITGTISGTLPTFFPIDSAYVGNITLTDDDMLSPGNLANIERFEFITDASQLPTVPADSIVLNAADVIDGIKNFDFTNQFNLFDNILLAVDGVDMFLEGIQYLLDTKIFSGLSLPVIGNPFTEGADFIEDFREDFIGPFRDLIETVENAAKDFADADKNIISGFLYDVLGPSGIDLLLPTGNVHPQNDGYYTDQLIGLATNLDQYLDDGSVELKDTYIQWNLTIGGEYEFGTDFGFDVGVPGLGLEADGDVSVSIAWDLDFGFGISFQDGFYLDISDDNELTAYLIVEMGDTTLVGTLGFLQLSAAVNEVDLGVAFEVNIKEDGATGDDADKLTFTELGKIDIDFGIAAGAIIDLALELGISADVVGSGAAAGFPKVGADFILDWGIGGFNSGDPEQSTFVPITDIGTELQNSLRFVGFQDITLDLGSFVSDVLGPIVGKVQDITEPIQPLIDFITTPFPVLSDFGLNITPLDLAAAYGQIDPGMIYAIADIITLINSIPDPDEVGSLKINFGDMAIYDDGNSEYTTGTSFTGVDLWNPDFDLSSAFNEITGNLESIFGDNWFSDALGTLAGEAADIMGDLTSESADTNPWAFPILEDPMQVFGLLMGRPAVLVTYDMEPLEFEFEWSQFFSIWGPLGVSVNVEFGATIDFAFGYDTLGIQEFIESDFRNPLLLFDGFYVSDTDLPTGDFGTDVPELMLNGGLWAAAEINLGVARAGVGGGVFIEIDFDLFDPDRDGRVRIKELVGNVVNEWNYGVPALAPLAIFDVHGEITAKLFAFLKIDLFLFEINKRWNITPEITILEFDIPFTRPPILATELEGGDLQINAGPYADQRLNGNISDIAENFEIKQDSPSGSVFVRAPGLWNEWQEYSMSSTGTVIFKGGEGDDVFDASGMDQDAIKFEIDAGVGNDTIKLGPASASGAAVIYGSEGDDTIYGGSGDDIIYGLKGNDTIYGGGGNDIIFGDDGRISSESITAYFNPTEDGNDTIYGGDGDDIIFGSGGDDTIYGDANNDLIIGDGGKLVFSSLVLAESKPLLELVGTVDLVANVDEVKGTQRDRFDPKGGNDILIGGADTDIIYGGTGNDTIDGGDGNDELYGEDGFDIMYGGSGADEIYGGTGGDTIYGERDPGAVAGKFDSQDLGTDGDDIIYGQDGRDTIHGDGGDDEIYGGSGADTLYGDADNDEIYGEGDPDIIYGGWGDDHLDGGAGSDVIFGDNGPDDFVAVTTGGPWNATVYGVNIPGEYLFSTTKSENPLAKDANDTIYSGMDSDFLDGQAGYDTYIIRLEGADNRAFTNVYDSGEDVAETDYMQIFGTMYDDEFLFRASSSITGLAFVALLNEDPNVERINYWNLERMLVTGSFGDDYFAVDDVRAETTITGDVGEDRFQVGQLYRSPRDPAVYDYNHVETEDVFATIETTVGWLSNGISRPMTIYGGTENDYFTVFHNKAVLSLFGEDGDDTFLIKAFALAGSQEPVRERTDVSGGAGADLVQYAMNAPVNIDGGDGFDTVIIIGTEFGDDFVVTKDGVYGAGLNVNFVNIESLSVDGAEGDDRFYVLSTGEKFITQIFGGLGSDTFNMSGPTPPIISNDLRGHSGVITHSIENTGTSYDVTKIAGISANVADNDKQDPTVVINEADGSTVITEGGLWDFYTIVLSKSPGTGSEVVVQVMAPVQTQDQKERESKAFRVSSPTATASTPDGTTVSLTFTNSNWFTPQLVIVSAPDNGDPKLDYDDDALEGPATGFINHVVTSSVGITGHLDSFYSVDQGDGTFVTHFTDYSTTFEETLVGYMLLITDGPGAGQSLRIKEVAGTHELVLFGEFRSDWNPDPTSIYSINQDIDAVRAVTVLVNDNDKAGVIITETDVSTEIFEGGDDDTINVVLTRQPTSDVEVTLLSKDDQLKFSSTHTDATYDVDGNLVLKFTTSNYHLAQTVTVSADDDIVREGFHHGLISFSVSSSDTDTDESATEIITLTTAEAYVGLKNRPKNGEVDKVYVDTGSGFVERNSSLYKVISNKVVFVDADEEFEFLTGDVKVEYTYVNQGYHNLEVKPVLTNIADNDVAQVKITETGGSTDVIEDAVYKGTATSAGDSTLTDTGAGFLALSGYLIQITGGKGAGQVRSIDSNTVKTITVTLPWDESLDDTSQYAVILPVHDGVPWTDTYEVVLTQEPDGDVEILVTPEITKTSAGKIIHWGKQVAVTSSVSGAVNHSDGTVTLTFTTGNWDTPQVVKVIAVDDMVYDGDDTQVFAPQLHTVSEIQGPLYLYGDSGYGSIIAFEPLMLHYELNDMKETDTVIDVGDDGTTITVGADKLLAGAAAINSNVVTVEDLVTEKMTITIADGVDEIGQFRLIIGAVLDDKETTDTADDEVTLTLNAPWELSESEVFDNITKYTITRMSENFFAVEEEQIDYLFVYNEDSQADNEIPSRAGLLTDSTTVGYTDNSILETFVTDLDGKHLSGFGMGVDLKIGGYLHPGGITYGDMEVVEINLGDGIDHFTVEDTHIRADGFQTWTIINTGDEPVPGDGDLIAVSLNSDVKELHSGTVTNPGTDTIEDDLAAFPVTVTGKGLAGYIVEITGGPGLGQRRVIASNTAKVLTLSEPWDVALDTTSNYRVLGAELLTGTVTGSIADTENTLAGDFSAFSANELQGRVIELIDGAGAGIKREIVSNTDTELTISSTWNASLGTTTVYRIYGDQDGPVSINTQAGEDTVDASASSIPLVIFGGKGNDYIVGGSADDIIFGDRGRVDYVNEDGKIVTLLGLVREKIDPEYVTAATETTLTDTAAAFPVETIEQPGLAGFMVSITDGRGFRQGPRLILSNTATTITLAEPWETLPKADPGGIFNPGDPDNNPSKYRISLIPEDQTDGVVRDPSLLIAIDETIGGNDIITGNDGNDRIFGGLGDDEIYGSNGEDIIFGDHGRLDYAPETVGGEDGPAMGDAVPATLDRVRTTFDNVGGGDTIYGDDGEDIILGGYNESGPGAPANTDYLYGNTGNDIIIGDNGLLDFSPNAATPNEPRDVYLDSVETIALGTGGYDIISGNAGYDIVMGGTAGDTIYGDDAAASAGDSDAEDILIGDNGEILLSGNITGRFNAFGSAINLIQTTDDEEATGGGDTIEGNAEQDVILGGVNNGETDTIYGDAASPVSALDGDDFILGDNGIFEFELAQDDVGTLGRPDVVQYLGGTTLPLDASPTTLDRVMTIDPTLGDDDTIRGDGGNDTIFGGTGRDKIWGDSDVDNQVDNAIDGDGADIIFGDHAKIYPYLPIMDSFFINNNFFSIDMSENDGFNTDGVVEYEPGTDFEDTIFGSGGDDTIIGGQDDDIIFGGADNDILLGGHNVLGGHDEMDDMDTASIEAILPDELAALVSSDVNDINDIMDGGSQNDVMAGDNAIIIRQNASTVPVDSTSPRYQLLTQSEIYSIMTESLDTLYDVDVGFSVNIAGVPQFKPSSDVGYTVILLNHSEDIQTNAAQNPEDPRVFGNDVMAGGSEDDEMFGQLGDDIMQGDGSIDLVSDTSNWQMPDGDTPFNPSPAVGPSFIIPDNQSTPTYFMVEGKYLLFHSDEAANDGDDYMEGNAGNDRMYGNLGQDDMIGGNSTLFGLDDVTAEFYGIDPATDFARPDGADMIYGGAGNPTRLARNDFVGSGDTEPTNDDVQIPEVNRHARDADVILGDNANIYRLVDGDGSYIEFAYDQDSTYEDRGGLRIVPRAVEFLDYWYTYATDLQPDSLSFVSLTGTGDLIYGESGDDIIHGMAGDDVLFGNSEDDDLYGEAGNDWVSGGTGEDGILGDDGLLKTSRNDVDAEPLYGVAALEPDEGPLKNNETVNTNSLNAEISTPGNIQRAIINVEGTLKKTVDLIVFNGGLANNETLGVNDIIYGGLNDDWIHAGAGDDAVSGAEALPAYYSDEGFGFNAINTLLQDQQNAPSNDGPDLADNPFWFGFAPYNPGDILRYEGNTEGAETDPHGKSTQEFALYDEFYPRRKIMLDANGEAVEHSDFSVYDFLLNFDENEGPDSYVFSDGSKATDGDDKIFGDLGNDWIVGGTGRDHMYGGRGDDLLNMDDNLNSGSGGKVGPHDPEPDLLLDNTQSDEFLAYADIAYGGAGRDVLILNTGADRAIDWVGEFNSYIVPFSPFGAFQISRTLQPQLPEFLFELSESDGIDTTVPDGARYVEQKGLDVRVDEPEPLRNGEPYGELGMVRQMDYDWFKQTGAPNDPQPGNLQGKRDIMRRELFQDTVVPKGAFAETEGVWTASDGKLEAAPVILGEDAVNIYHLDQIQPSYMEILVTINAEKDKAGFKSNAYIIFDYKSPTDFKFAGVDVGIDKIQIGHYTADGWIVDSQIPRKLKAGIDYDLTLVMYGTVATIWVDESASLSFDFGDPLYDFGMIGLATKNAVARFDDWQVQKLPPTLTFQFTEDFAGTSTNPFKEQIGNWMITDGHYTGSVVDGDRAITTWAIEVATWSLLEFEALIDTEATGGLIFDYYDADNFKFAAIDAIADHVVIGHHTSKGWFIDAEVDTKIKSGTIYNLGISMLGTSVSVTLDGEAVVGHVFNSLLNDGDLGLLSKDGVSSFDYVVARGDDPAYAEESGDALKVTSFGDATDITELNHIELAPIIDAAIDYWVDIIGVDASQLADVSFLITDLSEMFLAVTIGNTILIDTDAAGYGWFVDETPYDNIEFVADGGNGELTAAPNSEAEGSMDLLTVVTHELGHVLGLEDVDAEEHDLMSDTLATGVRRVYAEAVITTLPLDGWIVSRYSFNDLLNDDDGELNDDDGDLSAIHHGRKKLI